MLIAEEKIFIVLPEEAGKRLDALLALRFPDYSRTYFQSLIDQGIVLLNGQGVKKREIPEPGDRIQVRFEPVPEMDLSPEAIPLDLLFEDEHLLAVNKAAGMVVHPAPGHASGTFVNALLAHCRGLASFDDPLRPGIVHRLDKDTSGVLLAAKTTFAHQKLVELFSTRQMDKQYLAISCGCPKSGIVDAPIGRHPIRRKEMSTVDTGGKEAITEVRIVAVQEKLSLILLRPRTGRTHQIRVHMKHLGHPILGDELYGFEKMNRALSPPRLLLHAYRLAFKHPITGEKLCLHAPIPSDFKSFLEKSFRTTEFS